MVPAGLLDVGLILGGIVMLVGGAWLVVEAGSSLARRWGISPLWVGLTVVALGTSLPELAVTVIASLEAGGELAVSNVVGSNILNILIVLGATAAIAPVPAGGVAIRRNIVLVALASIGVWLLAADGVVHRAEGVILLALVPAYVIHSYREERRGTLPPPEAPDGFSRFPVAAQWIGLAGGIAIVLLGAAMMVEGAQNVALRAGMSPRVVGLTVVAIGTSLPELATSLIAAFRRRVDLALGNLIGSNILNLLLVLGAGAAARSATVSRTLWSVDMVLMIAAALLLLRFAGTRGQVGRIEGVLMLTAYLVYLVYLLGLIPLG